MKKQCENESAEVIDMAKRPGNLIQRTLLLSCAIVAISTCVGCAEKNKITGSLPTTEKSESAETTALITRPEGTSSGVYQDVLYNPTTDRDGLLPTGLPAGVVDPPQIIVNGKIYKYEFDGAKYLPDGYEEIGKILEVNDFKVPEEDFCAAGPSLLLYSGQSVYASKDHENRVVILCEDGYYFLTCD